MIGIRTPTLHRTPDRRRVMAKTQQAKQQQQQQPLNQYSVDFTSILRIRPLHKSKELQDHITLEKTQQNGVAVAILHPLVNLTSPSRGGDSPNFIHEGRAQDFHFDKILDKTASQESVFYAMGLSTASTAMEPLKKANANAVSSVVVAMGNGDSGKSHTIFGKVSKSQEGLVPRVLESLFSQSKHHVSSNKTFGVRMTMLLVEKNEVVRDLLVEQPKAQGSSSKKSKSGVMAMVASFEKPGDTSKAESDGKSEGVAIEHDPLTNDFVVDTSYQICRSAQQAGNLLQTGLQRSQTSRLASFGKSSSRGHVVVTLQPVLLNRTNGIDRFGGTICLVDLASKEKGKKARMNKDSISSDSTFAALMHCFRTMKHNKNVTEGRTSDIMMDDDASADGSDISNVSEPKIHRPSVKAVPWRQSKVTMLLQPMFSGTAPSLGDKKTQKASEGTTQVTLFMNAYPGHRDYAEKKSILCDLEILKGQELSRGIERKVETGMHQLSIAERPELTLSYSTSGDEEEEARKEEGRFDKPRRLLRDSPPRRILESPRPSAPLIVQEDLAPMPPPVAPTHSMPSAPALNDLPGVTLPTSSMHTASPPGVNPHYHAAPRKHEASAVPAHRAEPKKTMEATVRTAIVKTKSKLNIQPPPFKERKNEQNTAGEKKTNWMQSSPVKTLTTAVSAGTKQAVSVGTKQGKRALHKLDKMTRPLEPRPIETKRLMPKLVSGRMSNEFEVADDVLQTAMSHKLMELEGKNARLVDRNVELENKCEHLEKDVKRLQRELREASRLGRQQEWTQQDEKEWKHSRRTRLKDQDLIRSPLQTHLHRVEETYQINNTWLTTNKQHYGLEFPKWWKGAKELDKRDRELESMRQPDLMQSPTPALPQRPALARKLSGEKRKEDKVLNIEQYKRLKQY